MKLSESKQFNAFAFRLHAVRNTRNRRGLILFRSSYLEISQRVGSRRRSSFPKYLLKKQRCRYSSVLTDIAKRFAVYKQSEVAWQNETKRQTSRKIPDRTLSSNLNDNERGNRRLPRSMNQQRVSFLNEPSIFIYARLYYATRLPANLPFIEDEARSFCDGYIYASNFKSDLFSALLLAALYRDVYQVYLFIYSYLFIEINQQNCYTIKLLSNLWPPLSRTDFYDGKYLQKSTYACVSNSDLYFASLLRCKLRCLSIALN